MAPEMIKGENEYTGLVDVYSFGLILYEMIVGRPVFPPDTPPARLGIMIEQGVRPDLPKAVDPSVVDIIRQCWAVDPEVREPFAAVWAQLERIDFKIMANTDKNRLRRYLSQLSSF
jgi:serine/threonine protein kinase